MHNDSASVGVNDPAWLTTVHSLYQKVVREWIVKSLSCAPCTAQGLLQVGEYSCENWYKFILVLISMNI